MSDKEKSIVVSLSTWLLLLAYYAINVSRLFQAEGLDATGLFSLWGSIIILAIAVNIIANILTRILFEILREMRAGEEEDYTADERDKLIELKGIRIAYTVSTLGVFVAMLSFVINREPLMLFNLLVFAGFGAGLAGDMARLYFYRRGV